ncbi:MAG: hypothetical protein CM1200mP41_09950 [Gammaproteobacteria bacterium]|nr:MAG: hypothetical protein CM1200mP41_09950 [Gammaproteobacteria bacterium]
MPKSMRKIPVDLELSPGQMSLHHVRIIHGSNPNPTTTAALGFWAIRYIAATVRQSLGPRDFATLVRGNVVNDFWELEPRPKENFPPRRSLITSTCGVKGKNVVCRRRKCKTLSRPAPNAHPNL